MTIVQYIKSISDQLTGGFTFIHGTKAWQNLVADKAKLPLVFLDEPITSDDTMRQTGYLEPKYSLLIAFLDKAKLDWTPDQQQVVINKMRLQAAEFLTRLSNDDKNVYNLTNISRTDVQNFMDVNVSGCIMKVTFNIYDERSICV